MLNLFARQAAGRYCDGVDRREFLRIGGLGLGGLSLAEMLRLSAAGAVDERRRGKSVIAIFLNGGPSHIDMYDLKPDAPVEIRGEFDPISTNVPGVRVSQHMPEHARCAERWAVVNGVQMLDTHSAWVVMTGFGQKEGRPSFGSVASSQFGSSRNGIPTYVALGGENGADPGEPFYLGAGHRPFKPGGESLTSLSLSREVSLDRLQDRKRLLVGLDRVAQRVEDLAGNMAGHDAFTQQALEIVSSTAARDAFDLKQEAAEVQRSYGPAQRLLAARRLVEAGVPVVTLSLGGTICPPGDWDTHAGTDQRSQTNFQALKQKLPIYDRAVTTLINDLHARGLSDDVLLVVCGEFGRTPKINKNGGRDHWAPAGSVLFAGGGLRMGQAIGDTGPHAERAKDTNYTGQNVLATIYRHLGIDPTATALDFNGRPRYLLDDPRPIRELG